MRAKPLLLVVVIAFGAHLVAKRLSAAKALPSAGASTSASPIPSTSTSTSTSTSARPVGSAAPLMGIDDEAWTGVLLAQAVDLTARIETKVIGFSFRVGDAVHAGDAIAELETTAQKHEIAAAEAAVRASRADAWNASVSVAQARDRQNRRGRVMQVGATAIPLVSEEELADSKFDALSASSRASAASAMAEERQARLAHLRQVVTDATLRAPFDGVVATRYVELGAHVRNGQPVVRVVRRGALRVRFAVPEAEAGSLSIGSRIRLEWDDRALHAVIDRIAPEVESASSSVVMEAEVEAAPPEGNEKSALAGRVVGVRRAKPSLN
jgi:RND family efflux transporter MFP subunit